MLTAGAASCGDDSDQPGLDAAPVDGADTAASTGPSPPDADPDRGDFTYRYSDGYHSNEPTPPGPGD